MVAQSQGVNRMASVLWNVLMARTNRVGRSLRQLLQQRVRIVQIARLETLSGARCFRGSKFRHRTRLHVFDEPFAIHFEQHVVRISVG
jgi:hypothetical protein